jgi:5-methylcytosine-specific restriction endonuclease McrA
MKLSTVLIIAAVVLATFILLVMKDETLHRKHEKERRLLEVNLLRIGPDKTWLQQHPDRAIESLGYVAYLIWFLHCERKYRDYQGSGENKYPPDWEWRRRFVFLRDSERCQGCGIGAERGTPLDCHHLKQISQFAFGELGTHALTNLVTLCPVCHAGQHPDNLHLGERARQISSRRLDHLSQEGRQWMKKSSPNRRTAKPLLAAGDMEIFISRSDILNSQMSSTGAKDDDVQDAAFAHESASEVADFDGEAQERRWPSLSPEQQEATIREFLRLQGERSSASRRPLPEEQVANQLSEPEPLPRIAEPDHLRGALEAWDRAGKALKDDPKLQVPY